MDKLDAIGNDIWIGANATYSFWKHVCQLLLEMGTLGYLQFELERQSIPEESLKEINGRYLKFKVKQPALGEEAAGMTLTPYADTLIGQDSMEGYEGFVENSPEFLAQIEQLNQVWYVFALLALVMALGAFFIHRALQRRDGIKADFSQPQHNELASDPQVQDEEADEHIPAQFATMRHLKKRNHNQCYDDEQQASGPEDSDLMSLYGRLPDSIDKNFKPELLQANDLQKQSQCQSSGEQAMQGSSTAQTQQQIQQNTPQQAASTQQQPPRRQLQPRDIIVKQGDLETIVEEQEECTIADFSLVPENRYLFDEPTEPGSSRQKTKKNFLGNLAVGFSHSNGKSKAPQSAKKAL